MLVDSRVVDSLWGGGFMVTETGFTLSGRCSVTLSIMLSVSQVETSGFWFFALFQTDSTSSGSNLEQTLKLGPGRWGGEATMSASLVVTSTEGCGLAGTYAGTAGVVGSDGGAGR